MSYIQTRLAQVLAEHNAASVDLAPNGAFTFTCECKHTETRGDNETPPGSKREWLANHQAKMLDPVIRLARAGELLAAAGQYPTMLRDMVSRGSVVRWLQIKAESIYTPNFGPDCLAKKCRACDGRALDIESDDIVACDCICHNE